MACSEQILIEARWLLEHTTDWTRLDAQLGKLAESLQNTDQNFATRQSPRDGAWGLCYDEWFLKFDATIDALNLLADHGEALHYPLVFLQRIGSPDSLVTYLKGLLVSDIAETGIDRRPISLIGRSYLPRRQRHGRLSRSQKGLLLSRQAQ